MSLRSIVTGIALICSLASAAASQEALPATPELSTNSSEARLTDLLDTPAQILHYLVRPRRASRLNRSVLQNGDSEPQSQSRLIRSTVGTAAPPPFTQVVPITSFLGLQDNGAAIPPDTTGAVGPQHVMTTLNSQYRIQDRNGTELQKKSIQIFWNPIISSPKNIFDPRVAYDPYAQRWIATALANSDSTNSTILLAISATADPTGTWKYYSFKGDPTNSNWADYDNVGFNRNWIVITVNLVPIGGSTTNDTRILAINKSNAYSGPVSLNASTFLVSGSNSMVPAFTYDNTIDTMYLAEEWDPSLGQLRISTITGQVGVEILNQAPYPKFVNSNSSWQQTNNTNTSGNFAPQSGTTSLINTGDSRLMNLIYRNGSLWASQNAFLPATGTTTRCSVQWWQMTPTGTLTQFVRLDDPTNVNFFAYPGLAVNKDGFVILGFSQFSSSIFASAAYSYQVPGTIGQMSHAPIIYQPGTGPYFKDFGTGENRWGDFSQSVVDPADDTDLWTIQEYSASGTNPNTWATAWLHVWPGDGTLAAKPASFDYGLLSLQSSASQTITIANSATTPVNISSVVLGGLNPASYALANNCGATLGPGATCTLNITFTAKTAGIQSALVTINNNGVPAALQIYLTGTGQSNPPPDAFPGLPISYAGSTISVQTSNLTGDTGDPGPACQGNLVSAGQLASTAWYSYTPDADGTISYSASSTGDFALSVWTVNRRTPFYPIACNRATSGASFTVANSSLKVVGRITYYFMFSVPPGSANLINFNLPMTGSTAALTPLVSGSSFFPASPGGSAVQAIAIRNSSSSNQGFGISSSNPEFLLSFPQSSKCSPAVLATDNCVALVTYTASTPGVISVPHSTGTLSLSGNVTTPAINLQATLPSDLTPYSAAYARTIDSMPFSDTKTVPTNPISDAVPCSATAVAPLFYLLSPTTSGIVHVNLANYVVRVSGTDSSVSCYTQFGSGSDTGFPVNPGAIYTIEIGTDSRSTLPSSESITLTGSGSAISLSPSPIFFGTFAFGGASSAVPMTLTNGSQGPVSIAFPGSPFVIANSTCGSSLAAGATCTFNLSMNAPVPSGGSYPNTTTFSVGGAKATVSWISPPMTLLPTVSSLDYFSRAVGLTSPAQSIVVLMHDNVGSVQVQVTGDFAQTNDCTSASYARPYCTFSVTFKPTANGTRTGNLAITYNLNPPTGSPATLNIPLSGTGTGTNPPVGPRPTRGPRPAIVGTTHPNTSTVSRPTRSAITNGGQISEESASPDRPARQQLDRPELEGVH